MAGLINSLGNLISGGSWEQSGGELKQQEFNASQAQIARDFNSAEAEKSRNFNSAEAQKARDWQERMSNTAYQRAVNDMQAAGINPAMAFSNGASGANSSGASSASSGPASGSVAHSASSGNSSENIGGILQGVAAVANAFNNDNNTSNDVTLKKVAKTAIEVGKLLM